MYPVKQSLKYALLMLLLSVSLPYARAQRGAGEPGSITLDAYAGFPDFWTPGLRIVVDSVAGDLPLDVKGRGPFGIRGEYTITERFSAGLDIFYARTSIRYVDDQVQDSLGNMHTYFYELSLPRPRFLLHAAYHLGNERIDPYFAGGIGYNGSRFVFRTNDPGAGISRYKTQAILPLALRLSFGTRFFITDYAGLHFALGIGGPLFEVGLTARF